MYRNLSLEILIWRSLYHKPFFLNTPSRKCAPVYTYEDEQALEIGFGRWGLKSH